MDPEILNSISTNVTLNVIFSPFLWCSPFRFWVLRNNTSQSWSAKMDSKATSIGDSWHILWPYLGHRLFPAQASFWVRFWEVPLAVMGRYAVNILVWEASGWPLALPFALFALFPQLAQFLPRSGGWLNTVKVVLGFIEVALAFKFCPMPIWSSIGVCWKGKFLLPFGLSVPWGLHCTCLVSFVSLDGPKTKGFQRKSLVASWA